MEFEPIAIVGFDCVFPQALNPAELWANIAAGRDGITSAPAGLWRVPVEQVLTPGLPGSSGTTPTDRGGYIQGFAARFDPAGFGIEAREVREFDRSVQWLLHTSRQALRGAGLAGRDLTRAGLTLGVLTLPTPTFCEYAESVWRGQPREDLARNRFHPGLSTHRIAAALGLRPDALALDAACASSLYAIKLACDKLQDGTHDVMVAGAVSGADDLFLHLGFSVLKALSPSGRSRPFHREADGLLPAEGAGAVVLRRLADARRDGNPILGVIRGIGLSNDGRTAGLLSPSPTEQEVAIGAAYRQSGLEPAQISLLECHATGTPVGDAAELRSMGQVFGGVRGLPIGSVKSNLGHPLTAAGMAGLGKLLGALRERVRPRTLHTGGVAELTPALSDSPFRLLTDNEPWDVPGPRRAALNGFGFGGNNAHLIVEEWTGQSCGRVRPQPAALPRIAVVGLGVTAGSAAGVTAFTQALLAGAVASRRAETVSLDLRQAGFPPADLQVALPQQTLALQVAQEALAQVQLSGVRLRTGVFFGMECDPETGRGGLQSRLPGGPGSGENRVEWTAHSVLGQLANILANRVSSAFDLRGPSFAVSAGELSGFAALRTAADALRRGELDAALVGAVDLSCEPVHEAASRTLGGNEAPPGDAAICLVLKRWEDAQRDGDRVLAEFGPAAGDDAASLFGDGGLTASAIFGRAHAATALLETAAAVVCCSRGVLFPLRTWMAAGSRRARVRVLAQSGTAESVEIASVGAGVSEPVVPAEAPRLYTFSGESRAALAAALAEGRQSTGGPLRLTIVAASEAEWQRKQERAWQVLASGVAEFSNEGIHFRESAIQGELAFVYPPAGSAYPGMGRGLTAAFPEVLHGILETAPRFVKWVAWIGATGAARPDCSEKLAGTTLLSQAHTRLTREWLGLRPDAVIGMSAGETNSLLAIGVWREGDSFFEEFVDSQVFSHYLSGDFAVVGGVRWECWAVWMPPAAVQELLRDEPGLRLLAIHAEGEYLLAGDAATCSRAVARAGKSSAQLVDFPAVVHCPDLQPFAAEWRRLHTRPTWPPPAGTRVYQMKSGQSYEVSADSVADALTWQALNTLDYPRVIEQAWRDGVRVFLEHGPRGVCAPWIRRILGGREHLAVSLDSALTDSLTQAVDAVAQLITAGVQVDTQRFLSRLMPATTAEVSPRLQLPAHRSPVVVSAATASAPVAGAATPAAPATVLKGVVANGAGMNGAGTNGIGPPVATAQVAAVQVNAAHAVAAQALAAPVPLAAAAVAHPAAPQRETLFASHAALLRQHHAAYLASAAQAHEQFLAMSTRAFTGLTARLQGAAPVVVDALPVAALPVAAIAAPAPAAPAVPAPPAFAAAPAVATAAAAPAVAAATVVAAPPVLAPAAAAPVAAVPAAVQPQRPVVFDREQLEITTKGRISEVYGPQFADYDTYAVICRLPMPPMLLVDRVTLLEGEPGSMKLGLIHTETDIRKDSWFLHDNRIPTGLMIEAGQADMLLISWLGIDFHCRGERVYRMLGCSVTFHDRTACAGETLRYEIRVTGHARQGETRLFFFEYDCYRGAQRVLSVRNGQAGFFSPAELADSVGVLWDPATAKPVSPVSDPGPSFAVPRQYGVAQVRAAAQGGAFECFGPGFEAAAAQTRPPSFANPDLLQFETVDELDPQGGPWGRGYARARSIIDPDGFLFTSHFKDDPCLPGTVMLEGCYQLMAFYLMSRGMTLPRDGWRFEPVTGEATTVLCRGQVLPTSQDVYCELYVDQFIDGPEPVLFADCLGTVDGRRAFHGHRLGLKLVPGHLLDSGEGTAPNRQVGAYPRKPAATLNGVVLDEQALLATAWGAPSQAFGPPYARFDGTQRCPRLPGPPYNFMSRVVGISGQFGVEQAGATVEAEYDVLPDDWYFQENGQPLMPYSVLLEVGLQPCGWLSCFTGVPLHSEAELFFRNLDGQARQHRQVPAEAGVITTHAKLLSISRFGSITLVSLEVRMTWNGEPLLDMTTGFGFFRLSDLDNQVGLPPAPAEAARFAEPSSFHADLAAERGPYFEQALRLPHGKLRMIDEITGLWPAAPGCPARIRARKNLHPSEWFLKAHFYLDPVQPGSLGLEALVQTLQFYAIHAGWAADIPQPRFEMEATSTWKYRGQAVPRNQRVETEVAVREVEQANGTCRVTAEGWLWVDGKRVYHMPEFGLRIVPGGGERNG